MKNNVLKEKSYRFALRIVKLCRYLVDEQKEFVLSRKILDAGTSIGSHVEQAFQGGSTADFVYHLSVANQKAFDTDFWLRLLKDSEFITEKQAESMLEDCQELEKLLTSSIKTTKKNASNNE